MSEIGSTFGGSVIQDECPACGGKMTREGGGGSAEANQFLTCGTCRFEAHENNLVRQADRVLAAAEYFGAMQESARKAKAVLARFEAIEAFKRKTQS